MIKHPPDMRYRCLFDIDKGFIIEGEKDYRKRKIKLKHETFNKYKRIKT